VADQTHVALEFCAGESVAFGAGRMRSFIRQAVFVARISGCDGDVVLIFSQFVLDRRAVTVIAINFDGLIGVDQTFDFSGVRRVFEFREFRWRRRTSRLRARAGKQINASP
jgi:hypothetical protein